MVWGVTNVNHIHQNWLDPYFGGAFFPFTWFSEPFDTCFLRVDDFASTPLLFSSETCSLQVGVVDRGDGPFEELLGLPLHSETNSSNPWEAAPFCLYSLLWKGRMWGVRSISGSHVLIYPWISPVHSYLGRPSSICLYRSHTMLSSGQECLVDYIYLYVQNT